MARRAAPLLLAGLAGLFAAGAARAQLEFVAIAAKEIDAVVRFTPPDFGLGGGGRPAPVSFYGEAMNQFENADCERSVSFGIIALANMAGGITAAICAREAKRVRALAAVAQPRLAGVLSLLQQGGVRIDAAAQAKMGWTYARATGADGAEEHYFPLVAVGHGFAVLPTLVRVPRGARRAIVVQADTMKLCESYGLQDKTPLCRDTRQALADIARRLDARVAD